MIEEVNSIISQKAAEEDLLFRAKIKGCEDRYVMMDTEYVERILINLLSNAVKFSKPGGTVDFVTNVTYKNGRARHVYTITDNGMGISEEFRKKMFMPFEQENRENIALRDGQGLGLYICKNLVDLLQGTINCESVKGKGTTFTVVLEYELASEEQIRLHRKKFTTYEDNVLYGKNVLVAEDNSINAEVIMKILENRGVQAIRESGTADALTIPIIALTADAYDDLEGKCLNAGMDGYLKKPIDTEELFRVLAREFDK